ncbi:Rv1733c family protein [Streptomyces tremellae]|uniref:Transmembrane protein n=1 Tax=Streptomyces tremellae TaxID=1124239 RepID=A0ABP7EER1_9ACTN
MRVVLGIWRWRHNPLRRTTDLVEAWLAVLVAALLVFGAPAAGWLSGAVLGSSLQRTVAEQRHDRQESRAVMVTDSRQRGQVGFFDPESAASQNADTRVIARWTTPGDVKHVGPVTAPRAHLRPGDTFSIWTDTRGRQVPPPISGDAAHFHAVFSGITATLLAAALLLGAWRLAVWRLVHQRYKRLDRQWAQVGPDWGRTGTGS